MRLPQNSWLKNFDQKLESTFIMNPYRYSSGAVGGWKELGRTTLGGAASSFGVDSLSDKRYYMILANSTQSGVTTDRIRLGNGSYDSGNNYGDRWNIDGAGDSTAASTIGMLYGGFGGVTDDFFRVGYLANLSAKEKLGIMHKVGAVGAGATNAPRRAECAGKWANTSNPLDRIQVVDTDGSGTDYESGSEIVVLGWDPADTHTNNFWQELASVTAGGASTNISSGTITAKKYLWVQAWLESTDAHVTNMTFNNDTSTYAYRNSDDGGADATSTSDSHIEIHQSTSTGIFVNMFIINNSANEKLVMGHTVGQSTAGAGTAPIRREFAGKYDNTAAQITEIDLDSSSGNWSSNSIIKVWGSD